MTPKMELDSFLNPFTIFSVYSWDALDRHTEMVVVILFPSATDLFNDLHVVEVQSLNLQQRLLPILQIAEIGVLMIIGY